MKYIVDPETAISIFNIETNEVGFYFGLNDDIKYHMAFLNILNRKECAILTSESRNINWRISGLYGSCMPNYIKLANLFLNV